MRDLYAMYGTKGATSVGSACIMRSTVTLIPEIASFSLPGTNIPELFLVHFIPFATMG